MVIVLLKNFIAYFFDFSKNRHGNAAPDGNRNSWVPSDHLWPVFILFFSSLSILSSALGGKRRRESAQRRRCGEGKVPLEESSARPLSQSPAGGREGGDSLSVGSFSSGHHLAWHVLRGSFNQTHTAPSKSKQTPSSEDKIKKKKERLQRETRHLLGHLSPTSSPKTSGTAGV